MKLPCLTMVFVLCAAYARASSDSTGPNGIDSIATNLTGFGVPIGQAEPSRAGKPGYDTDPMKYASNTIPMSVYRQGVGGFDFPNGELFPAHPTEVAGVMIAKRFPSGPISPCSECVGVAPNAELHSMAMDTVDAVNTALGLNRLATLAVDVKAINLSFNREAQGPVESVDGNSHFTQFIDWSARRHDVLYVVAWGNESSGFELRLPTDNYNGMTVAGSERVDGVYRKWWNGNSTTGDAEGDRSSIDLLAPRREP